MPRLHAAVVALTLLAEVRVLARLILLLPGLSHKYEEVTDDSCRPINKERQRLLLALHSAPLGVFGYSSYLLCPSGIK